MMRILTNRDLMEGKGNVLGGIDNGSLLRYLSDENEITLLVTLYQLELLILSLPVAVGDLYDFKRVLLIDEEDGEGLVLVYQEELAGSEVFGAFLRGLFQGEGSDDREGLFEVAVGVFLQCLDDLKRRYERIESRVLEEPHVDENILLIMRYDTVVQKVLPNIEGISLLVEEAVRKTDFGNRVAVNRLTSLKIELAQIRGMVAGLSQLGENISHTIDSINNYMLNRVMRTLTILTVCIAIPTLIAGVYGMNVPLPFQEFEWIMQLISLFSFLIIMGVLLVFKRRRYF